MSFVFGLLLIVTFVFLGAKIRIWKIEMKGKVSESLAYHKMLQLSDEYTIFNDLLFNNDGYSTQIDHLVVSPYGIFVIETKGYKGWILGGENAEYWTQSIYGKKYQFYNPIKQNDGHVRFLRHLLKCAVDIPFIPIVVFNNSADVKVNIRNHIVVNRCNLTKVIKQYQNRLLSDETIAWIIATLQKYYIIADKEDIKSHKNNVKMRQYRTHAYINNRICPECGGTLVKRKGKYGSFYGCSNYPKCKFTTK